MTVHYSDDTSVAIIEKVADKTSSCSSNPDRTTLHFLENVTADNRQYRGIHPVVSLESHQNKLTKLIEKALGYLPPVAEPAESSAQTIETIPVRSPRGNGAQIGKYVKRVKPDFISVTRGPGMFANLSAGVDTAKGLAVAWQIPVVGVHHMQAHLLTPRLASSLQSQQDNSQSTMASEFPFLSLLVSGGHTQLVHSKSLTDHEILGSTIDIAIGTALDKFARMIIPSSYLEKAKTTMYGKLLEQFAFPNGAADYANYTPPAKREQEIPKFVNQKWGWLLGMPYAESRQLAFSYAGLLSTAQKQIAQRKSARNEKDIKTGEQEDPTYDLLPYEARVDFARDYMRFCFEHLASRTVIALTELSQNKPSTGKSKGSAAPAANDNKPKLPPIKTLVVSGGVAANRFLLHLLRSFLDIRGFSHVNIVAPPLYLCTDNAAMIGWTGIEMFEAGWQTDLNFRAVREWPLGSDHLDGGILGAGDWVKNNH